MNKPNDKIDDQLLDAIDDSVKQTQVESQENTTVNIGNTAKKTNKFDIFWLKVWTAICSIITFISTAINKTIKAIFRKEVPLRYVKAFVSVVLIIMLMTLIITPFRVNYVKSRASNPFSDGLIPVQKQVGFTSGEDDLGTQPLYKWGYVGTNGKIKLQCIYEKALEFKHGVAWVLIRDEAANASYWHLIGKNGKVKKDLRVLQVKNGIIPVGEFSDDEKLAWVYNGGKFSYVKTNGKPAFTNQSGQFDECGNFNDGVARVRVGRVQYYIGKNGKKISDEYEQVRDFSDGLGAVKKNDCWGFVDKKGNIKIEVSYDFVSDFKGGHALVKNGSTYGLINQKGKKIINMGDYVDMGILKYFGMES